jgi:malate dehydrogenase (oxaloacetate-decarboxylating)
MSIAHAVGRQAIAEGVAPARDDEQLAERIRNVHWTPEYRA